MSTTSITLESVVVAELIKLRTLPAVALTVAATPTLAAGLAAVLAISLDGTQTATPVAVHAALQAVPYAQVGFILLGILAVASEYTGSQIQSTLTSVPRRCLLLAGKTVAYLLVAMVVASTTVVAAVTAAHIAVPEHRLPLHTLAAESTVRHLAGAIAYLTLIGLVALAAAVLIRNPTGSLATMLGLVLVVSPLLHMVTEWATYLPDVAGAQLYQPEPELSPLAGGTLLLAWTAGALTVSAMAFQRRDA
jgi:ABC-type transport system involved in multi-copper enzyme maturation permease subunit